MNRRILFLPLVLCSLLVFAGCQESSTPKPSEHKLIITGSSTMAPLMADIGKRFESKHPGVRVDVQTGGSSRGVQDARTGLAHIGMASRALTAQEAKERVGITLAKDGIGLIVHKDNPVTNLTTQHVIDIYTGIITHWQAVGGSSGKIVGVNKAEGRATLDMFLAHFHLANAEIRADIVIGDNEQGIKTVAGNPQALGYVSIGTAEYDATHGVPIRLLQLDGIPASLVTVQNGTFPISRPLTLVTTTQPSTLAQTFIAFATSSDIYDLVAQHYFIPLAS